jgi:hypothetical protein
VHESKKKFIFNESKNRKERIPVMTDKNIFHDTFPQDKQIGGSHYKKFLIQPYEFISKNALSFFQGNVVKYVCRYKNKAGIQDLEKIIHYCELEIKTMKDIGKK